MKIIWLSDIHLNFLKEDERLEFYNELKSIDSRCIVISGDIAESHNLKPILMEMREATDKTIYFVAGNHDYYGSSIRTMRAEMKRWKFVKYLPKRPYYKLNRQTALVGADGWGDGRNGDYENSRLIMADWSYIRGLKKAAYEGMTFRLSEMPRPNKPRLLEALQKIADADAHTMVKNVRKALTDPYVKKIIMVSHVPPFEEACLYAGRKSTDGGLPFFSSQIFGTAILPTIEQHPEIEFLWLCGHTHSGCTYERKDNFIVKVAGAEYFKPTIAEVICLN